MKLQSSAPLPEGAEIGRYRLLQALSSGGFSIVYLAYSEHSEECVAIKEYMPANRAMRRPGSLVPYIRAEDLAPYKYGLAAFFEEARILAAINHPNIVQVLELVRANETIYMVMQFIEGTSLEKYILDRRVEGRIAVLPEDFIVGVFARVLDGLQEAHERNGAVGAWSDVYGIGACMLACMSARPPQEATSRAREDLVPLALEILERSYSPQIG